MNMSDSGWFKKFLGENPSAKLLRERLEEATALLAAKDEALAQQERRLTDATALAEREKDHVRELDSQLRELSQVTIEADLSRSVTEDQLKQAEAKANQLTEALAAERTKFVAASQSKAKAEVTARALTSQVQKLEKQVLDSGNEITRLEQERASAQEAKALVESALARSERRRETALAELVESRKKGELLSIANEEMEAKLNDLQGRLDASAAAVRDATEQASRCRAACAEVVGVAVDALYAVVGRTLPVALRVITMPASLGGLAGTTQDASVEQVIAGLERWLSDAGVPVTIRTTPTHQTLIELKGGGPAGVSKLCLGYWVAGLTMQRLSSASNDNFELASIDANESTATVALRRVGGAHAAG